MDTRRDFLKKAALLAGSTGAWDLLPEPLRKALAIDPAPGSTCLDAEHVVILMQENRSFDHAFGSLQGVRGFDDPRAIRLPDGKPVWCQTNAQGETYAPFRLNLHDSKATWMSSLPHTWPDQVDARNGGAHDGWLEAKRSHWDKYAHLPLTLGYYNREDIPFYYALADAFTICDQNFCSALTGTTPNRLYLWTGTIREEPKPESKANVRNEDVDYDHIARWKTFPERLDELDVVWKIYQNELSLPVGFEGEEEAWLSNFGDNPLEWFEQYHAKFSPAYYRYLQKTELTLTAEIQSLTGRTTDEKLATQLREKESALAHIRQELVTWSPERYAQLPEREKKLHEKAFTVNCNDPDYHRLTGLTYRQDGDPHTIALPQGDVLHQFRTDVQNGALPAVSWLVAPQNFSDHPSAPWYGAWYLSEVVHILTENPKVWEKTIFILAYDENDGYFDHVPPFVPPHPDDPRSGRVSGDIDTRAEFVTREQEKDQGDDGRTGPIGLGYRVPLVIASPWSRGGRVCSEVFDHTSVLQFLEKWLGHKTGKPVLEPNIGSWRRAICGDLTSVFRPYKGEHYPLPRSLVREELVESIFQAQFKPEPTGYQALTPTEIQRIGSRQTGARQEKGSRPSCALPYELYADGDWNAGKKAFEITFAAGKDVFGKRSAGAPFQVYGQAEAGIRTYAVSAGDHLRDTWPVSGGYRFQVLGPNGFFREFAGTQYDPALQIFCRYQQKTGGGLTGKLEIRMQNTGRQPYRIAIEDPSYRAPVRNKLLDAGKGMIFTFDLRTSYRWYDFSIRVEGFPAFERRFAGRVETGEEGFTDPLIGA